MIEKASVDPAIIINIDLHRNASAAYKQAMLTVRIDRPIFMFIKDMRVGIVLLLGNKIE